MVAAAALIMLSTFLSKTPVNGEYDANRKATPTPVPGSYAPAVCRNACHLCDWKMAISPVRS